MKLKKSIREVQDPSLRSLYATAIQSLEPNLQELIQFYPLAPETRHPKLPAETGFYAGDLLGLAKTSVRNYAIAITETATPALRNVLLKQLNAAILLHAQVFHFMYERSFYPSYNLDQLLANDINLARTALSFPY